MSGLISRQFSVPRLDQQVAGLLGEGRHRLLGPIVNSRPLTYGNAARCVGLSPASSVSRAVNRSVRKSSTSDPSDWVCEPTALVNWLSAKMPVSSAKKQNSSRVKKTLRA